MNYINSMYHSKYIMLVYLLNTIIHIMPFFKYFSINKFTKNSIMYVRLKAFNESKWGIDSALERKLLTYNDEGQYQKLFA